MRKKRQPGLERRFARGEHVPIIVHTKQGDITIRVGRLPNGNFLINAPKNCDIILPDRRPKSA
jgi:hypothetical protein